MGAMQGGSHAYENGVALNQEPHAANYAIIREGGRSA